MNQDNWRRWAVAPAAVVAGVVFTLLLAYVVQDRADRITQAQFESDAARFSELLKDRIGDGVLIANGARSWIETTENVDVSGFNEFASENRRTAENLFFPDISVTVGFDVGEEEQTKQNAGLFWPEDLRIWPDLPEGDTRQVVVSVVPDTNLQSIGLDLLTVGSEREAVLEALNLQRPRASAPVPLVQYEAYERAVLIYLPYQRDDGLSGVVSVICNGDDLADSVTPLNSPMSVEIVDVVADEIVGSSDRNHADEIITRSTTDYMYVHGRVWAVTAVAHGSYEPPWPINIVPYIVGFTVTLLSVGLLFQQLHMERRGREYAELITQELRSSEAALAETNTTLETSNAELATVNAELDVTNSRLRIAYDDLSQFAFVASHDLKEPLRMVSGYLSRFEKNLTKRLGPDALAPKEQRALGFVHDGVSQMQTLIAELLSLATAKDPTVISEAVNVAALVRRCEFVLSSEITATGMRVVYDALDPVVMDPRRAEALILHLVNNAIKYRRSDINPLLHIETELTDSMWTLRVSDNGVGVKPRDRERVFDSFSRVHPGARLEESGIGLAVCRAIVAAHRGRIWMEDGIGTGIAVVVEIPQDDRSLASTSPMDEPSRSNRESRAGSTLSKENERKREDEPT